MNKICNKCNLEKTIELFFKDKTKKDGYRNQCKDCEKERISDYKSKNSEKIKQKREDNRLQISIYNKKYYIENKSKISSDCKSYYQNNREEILLNYKESYEKNKESKLEYAKEYYIENSDKIKQYQKKYRGKNKKKLSEKHSEYTKKRKNDDRIFHLLINIRSLIGTTIRNNGGHKSKKTIKILGCNVVELKSHLESKFESWMNWKNYGKYNGEFDYGWDIDHIIPISSASSEEELINLNHYTNLQPLCSKVNRYIKKSSI